jgi:N-acetylneuraminate synthase
MSTPPTITIADRAIGQDHPPFIIAEMSGNHDGSLEKALAIVDAAAKTGADALKLQTYTADTMTLDVKSDLFTITDPKSLWHGRTLHDLYEEAHTPWDWHPRIMERCRQHGLIVFSSPFDFTAVDFLEDLNVPAYKIASFENTDHALLRKVASTGKPIIMSTGMSTSDELEESVNVLREAGCQELILLKCTSAYPAPADAIHLRTLKTLRQRFGTHIGLSDHTLGTGVSVAAVALGAVVIEKHFTLDRADGGVDAAFSMEPAEMASLVQDTQLAWEAQGNELFGRTRQEEASLVFRRSLFVAQDVAAGEQLSEHNVRAIRPGFGLPPKYLDTVLGKTVIRSVPAGTPVSWELLGMDAPDERKNR